MQIQEAICLTSQAFYTQPYSANSIKIFNLQPPCYESMTEEHAAEEADDNYLIQDLINLSV